MKTNQNNTTRNDRSNYGGRLAWALAVLAVPLVFSCAALACDQSDGKSLSAEEKAKRAQYAAQYRKDKMNHGKAMNNSSGQTAKGGKGQGEQKHSAQKKNHSEETDLGNFDILPSSGNLPSWK